MTSLLILLLNLIQLSPSIAAGKDINIDLEETIKFTLQNNSKIKLAINDYKIALAELYASPHELDYNLSASFEHKNESTLSEFSYYDFLAKDKTTSLGIGLTKKLKFGTETELSLQNLKIETTESSLIFKTRYQTGILFSISQPILKGAGKIYNESTQDKAKFKSTRFKTKLLSSINDQLYESSKLYWDLLLAQKELGIRRNELDIIQRTHISNKKLFSIGQKSRIDLLNSEAQLAISEAQVEKSLLKKLDAELKLAKEILTNAQINNFDTININQDDFNILDKNLSSDIQLNKKEKNIKINKHPDIHVDLQELKEIGIELKKSKNDLLPKLDISFEYLSTGLSTKLGTSVSDALSRKTPSWEIALNFSYPIGNHGAKGKYKSNSAKFNKKSSEIFKKKRDLNQKIKQAQRITNNSLDILKSLKLRLRLANRKYKFKSKLYRLGKIDWNEFKDSINEKYDLEFEITKEFIKIKKEELKVKQVYTSLGANQKVSFLNKTLRKHNNKKIK